MSPENLHELAQAYHPFVAFADTERFYPALAEAWLTHATSAAWPGPQAPPAGVAPDRSIDPFRRGTGVCDGSDDMRIVQVLGGTPNTDDRPLQFTNDPADPDSIGRFRNVDGSTFVNFGGWADRGPGDFVGLAGDLDYLARAFSELSSAMGGRSWTPVDLMAHLPTFWVRQPPTPTTYCEARIVRDFAELSATLDTPDFPAGSAATLDGFLELTYHYLFPAREPSEGEAEIRAQEGQWAAISIFFACQGAGADGAFFEPPVAVVAGQGSDAPGPVPFASEARRWDLVAKAAGAPTHPVLLASLGTHRFFFAAASGPWSPGGPPSTTDDGHYDNNSEFPGWESVLIGGLLAAAAAAALWGGPAGWVVAAIIAIVALIIWLISLIADLCNDSAENPANPFPTNPEAGGDGPWGGDDSGPPAPGPSGGSGGASGGGGATDEWGLPNAGSPSGANAVSFDVRFIDRVGTPGPVTAYPSDRPDENPSWWDFPGRWGVRVAPSMTSSWASGNQRIDEQGRCLGYWHALRFLRDVVLGP
jgi:hypothetical protein